MILREWGDFVIRHMHFADEYGENLLYTYAMLGEVQREPGSDRILCPDMPTYLQRVEIAVKHLPRLEGNCLRLRYCSPLKDDGNPYTNRELASSLRTSQYTFKRYVRTGRRKVENALT